jgi:hypothetical protein
MYRMDFREKHSTHDFHRQKSGLLSKLLSNSKFQEFLLCNRKTAIPYLVKVCGLVDRTDPNPNYFMFVGGFALMIDIQ